MFLSRLLLNPRSRDVRRDLASPYEMHRTLLRAFPPADEGGPRRVLFRLEPERDGAPPMVLVQSQVRPAWQNLAALPDYLLRSEAKAVSPVCRAGQRLRFRLRANPTMKRAGKRLGLMSETSQRTWLERKAAAAGFRIAALEVLRTRTYVSPGQGPGAPARTLLGVDFEGLLEVTDPALLQKALAAGLGSAKGFGFGLLSLARA